MIKQKTIVYADDKKESIGVLVRLRLPWLLAGLAFGALMTLLVSRFEKVLSTHLQLAFFIPFIVYISDAVGAQTGTIYVRNLRRGRNNLGIYIVKELLFGIITGMLFGALVGFFAYLWLHSASVAMTVGLSMAASISTATVLALIVPTFLQRERTDPALGTAPLSTVIQDTVSLAIYFFIASAIIFR